MSALNALWLHGAGGGSWEWNRWRPVWEAEGVRVAAPDLEPIDAGLAATALDDYAVQARAALRALPRPRAVVGASLGGLLAAMVADEADALVLVNPLPPAPFAQRMPAREWPDTVRWRGDARLAATCRALPDADDATRLFAFRHWRDESGRVLREAQAGVEVPRPACPTLCIASLEDDDVPAALTCTLAHAWEADLMRLPTGHVGPLLGRNAATYAHAALAWARSRLHVPAAGA